VWTIITRIVLNIKCRAFSEKVRNKHVSQHTLEQREYNFLIGKNKYYIISLAVLNEHTHNVKTIRHCYMLTSVKQPTTQFLILYMRGKPKQSSTTYLTTMPIVQWGLRIWMSNETWPSSSHHPIDLQEFISEWHRNKESQNVKPFKKWIQPAPI